MENKNYKVEIKDIFVGRVQDIFQSKLKIEHEFPFINLEDDKEPIWSLQNKSFLFKKEKDYINYGGESTNTTTFNRSILFTLDENNHANDLLYNSPHYPIFDISPNEEILNASICIGHSAYELYELLKYLGYPNEIGYDEVLEIRNTLFSCDYVMHNSEKFGIIKTDPKRTCYDGFDSNGEYMTFNDTIEGFPLHRCYFDAIMECKDSFVCGKGVVDEFKPNEKEGPILRLK